MPHSQITSGLTSRLATVHVGDGVATGTVDNVYMVVWRKGVTLERFRIQESGLRGAIARNRRRTGVICVIEPSSTPPSEDLKRAARDMLKRAENDIACLACVIEGDGFRAAMIRAVLSTIQLLMGERAFEMKFFGSVGEASAWTGRQVGLPSAGLGAATEEVRAMLDTAREVEPSITQTRLSLRRFG